MEAGLLSLNPRLDFDDALSVRDKARDFVSIDCAVWISRVMGAVQRQDQDAVAHFCRTMRDTLQDLGATATLDTTMLLEVGCEGLGRAQTLCLCRRLMRDVTRLADRLCAQLSDPAWCAPQAPRFARDEIPTAPGGRRGLSAPKREQIPQRVRSPDW